MTNFIPLKTTTDFSLLQSSIRSDQLADGCASLGYGSCVLSDEDTLSGSIKFTKACKDKGLKPIIGCNYLLSDGSKLQLIARNENGWRKLLKLTAYKAKNNLSFADIGPIVEGKDVICITGGIGSYFANSLFQEPQQLYVAQNNQIEGLLRPDFDNILTFLTDELINTFGKENVFFGINKLDTSPANEFMNNILENMDTKGIEYVALTEANYLKKEDAMDQRILLCSLFRTSLREASKKILAGNDLSFIKFFQSNKYYLPDMNELKAYYSDELISNTILINDMCENYNVLGKLSLPKFDCPNGLSEDAYLRELCIEGWKKKIVPKIPKEKLGIYGDRVKTELGVINGAGLAGYFLIVQDYVNYAKTYGLVGPGRGSAGGSLVAMLAGITSVDPIPYNLLFERFYNAGRNTKDRISLPDIDCDFPISVRKHVIEYIRNKYGHNKVSQISTFGRMQGRSIIKEVFNAHEACSFDEMNKITEFIPDESKIIDDLQEMEEESGESSIVRWALENNAEKLKEWAEIDDKGEIVSQNGNFGNLFAQAIRLEGIKKSRGKHAAGIVIAPKPLEEMVPITKDKNSDELIAGLEMNDLEAIGLVKMDILGIAVLDKLMGVKQLVETGKLKDE